MSKLTTEVTHYDPFYVWERHGVTGVLLLSSTMKCPITFLIHSGSTLQKVCFGPSLHQLIMMEIIITNKETVRILRNSYYIQSIHLKGH